MYPSLYLLFAAPLPRSPKKATILRSKYAIRSGYARLPPTPNMPQPSCVPPYIQRHSSPITHNTPYPHRFLSLVSHSFSSKCNEQSHKSNHGRPNLPIRMQMSFGTRSNTTLYRVAGLSFRLLGNIIGEILSASVCTHDVPGRIVFAHDVIAWCICEEGDGIGLAKKVDEGRYQRRKKRSISICQRREPTHYSCHCIPSFRIPQTSYSTRPIV